MLTSYINSLFITCFCIMIYKKTLNMQRISLINMFCISVILAFIIPLIDSYFGSISYIIVLLILWAITSIINANPKTSFITVIISFSISFSIYALISFLLMISIPVLRNDNYFIILSLLTGILQYSIINYFFSIKRFKKGIQIFSSSLFVNIAIIVCLILICIIIYTSLNFKHPQLLFALLVLFILTLAFLIYWWQAQITKSYRRSIEKRELESLRTEVAEKDSFINKLLDDNERLATITHRDNTLISTLKNATVNYLMTDFESETEAKEARDRLIANIESLSEGRTSLPLKGKVKNGKTFDTGLSLLDELLHYMDEDAITNNIIFTVNIAVDLTEFVPKDISESELVHVIDDLLKNAFKATKHSERRMVQLQFYKLEKHFVVEVADNGIPFEIVSLVNMGIEKITTYEDGSGIGLMDIWNTKEACRATYHLEEYASAAPFTKKISLTFDKKNRYSIRTYRKAAIQKMSKRIDLQIY